MFVLIYMDHYVPIIGVIGIENEYMLGLNNSQELAL